MGDNDSPQQDAPSRHQIRVRVLLPFGLLLVAISVFVGARYFKRLGASDRAGTTSANAATSQAGSQANRLPEKTSTAKSTSSDPETARLIAQMFDSSYSLQARRQAARLLAKLCSADAMLALKTALTNDCPPYVKVAIAEGLGQCSTSEAADMLHALAGGKDETVARGAVRGLALRGDADAVDALQSLLFSVQTPLSVRTEAALGLGDISLPGAQEALTRAVAQIQDPDVLESVLDGLGRRPFADTQAFFANYLNSTDVSGDSKVLAIEAISDAEGNVAPFLLKYIDDPDPDVRAAALAALSTAQSDASIAPQILTALGQETDPNVRAQLYTALAVQSGVNTQNLLQLVQNETDTAAQLAGLECLATALQSSPDALAYFNATAVPQLEKVALGTGDLQDRLSSLVALGQARTPDAINALRDVAQQSPDTRVAGAAKTILQSAGI